MKSCALLLGFVFLLALTGNVRARAVDVEDYEYAWDYCDGTAWICYYMEDNLCLSSIDKTGKVIFQYETGLTYEQAGDSIGSLFSCSGGYAYVTYNESDIDTQRNDLVALSPSGIVKSYPTDTPTILYYGCGYVVTREHYADFDSNGYIYTIYDGNGDTVVEKDSDQAWSGVHYFGKGIFCFTKGSVATSVFELYQIESGECVEVDYDDISGAFYRGDQFAEGENAIYLRSSEKKENMH